MIVLLAFVFGVLLLAWLMAGLIFLATVAVGTVWTFSELRRLLRRSAGHHSSSGGVQAADARFLHDIGVKL